MPEGAGRPTKLSEIARVRFKQALADGRIRTGAFVSQSHLVRELDVPVGALREAMQILESEGLLTIMPRSGIQIVKPDLQLLRDTFQLRRILELEATRKFVETARDDEIEAWRALHADVVAEARSTQADSAMTKRAIDLDGRFHLALVTHLRNTLVTGAYNRTMELLNVIRLDSPYAVPRYALVPSMTEHLAILGAMQERDADGAARLMEQHLAGSFTRAMSL